MSLKAKEQPDSELDHIRHTLADLVNSVGQTRAEMHQRFDQHDKRFDEYDRRFDEHDRRFDEHDRRFDDLERELGETRKDIGRLELLIRQLLPNANN